MRNPQEVDPVAVGRARLDRLLGAPRGTPELVDGDGEDDEADQDVEEVDRGQEVVEGEEFVVGEGGSPLDLQPPFEQLRDQEHRAEEQGRERMRVTTKKSRPKSW
jgi:hypothetical protein